MINIGSHKRWSASLMAVLWLAGSFLAVPVQAQTTHENIEVAYNNFQVCLQGQMLALRDANDSEVSPFSYQGTIFLPLRAIAEALGLGASYNNETHVVSLTGAVSTSPLTAVDENTGTLPNGEQSQVIPPEKPTGEETDGAPPPKPTGDETTGTPPEGTPPEGTPPEGTPPEGINPTGTPSGEEIVSGENNSSIPQYEQIEVDYNDITVALNGETLLLLDANGESVYPFAYNGTVYLPVRAICQALGLDVAYDSSTRMVSMTSQNSNSGVPTGEPGNTSTANVTGTGAYQQSGDEVTQSDQTITAAAANESCVKVTDGGIFKLSDSTLDKTGDSSSEESSNFTGLNAGVLAESASAIYLEYCEISTDASGSNAVFATGEGSSVYIANTTIVTRQNSSRGLDATYNGTVTGVNVDITTSGDHCAALATDRGEGTIDLTGGTLRTAGEGSPGIYSTGTIKVDGADISATGSEAAVVEGKNSITLNDTDISGAVKCGVMMYQSFSGDADVGTSDFSMTGGSLTAGEGPLFYCTNTRTSIELHGVDLNGGSSELIKAGADQWGTSGSNGAEVSFQADAQNLTGDIIADSISSITMTLQNATKLEGAINSAQSAQSITLNLDASSSWIVTADSYLTVLTDTDESLGNIDDNGFAIYYDPDAAGNSWLDGETITLSDGGKLAPI